MLGLSSVLKQLVSEKDVMNVLLFSLYLITYWGIYSSVSPGVDPGVDPLLTNEAQKLIEAFPAV